MRVLIAIPQIEDLYPIKEIKAGLENIGCSFEFDRGNPDNAADRFDLLLTWSPWNGSYRQRLQQAFNAAGKKVLVMENGWLSPVEIVTHFNTFGPEKAYQLAFDGWNGTGTFRTGIENRWASWGHAMIAPWREPDADGHILVIEQRGHPTDQRSMPPRWAEQHACLCAHRGAVRLRKRDIAVPLAVDLQGCKAMHVWTSNAATIAMLNGIPVVCHGPNHMLKALTSAPDALSLYRGPRTPEFERAAWAQWTESEIATGEAFAWLMMAKA